MSETDGKRDAAPILVVDDEATIVEALQAVLTDEGFEVDVAEDGEGAWELLDETAYGLVVLDLNLPDMGGLELFDRIREEELGCEVIIITGEGSVDSAVQAMRNGAYDYLTKPLETDRLKALVPKALEKYDVREQKAALERKVANLTRYGELTGQSDEMKEIYKTIEAVAPTDASILIYGESGTGKELVARALHDKSHRSDGPFIAVNCAAFPKDILENARWSRTPRSSSSGRSRPSGSAAWGARTRSRSTSACSRRPTATSTRRSGRGTSGRTSTTVSRSWRSTCRR